MLNNKVTREEYHRLRRSIYTMCEQNQREFRTYAQRDERLSRLIDENRRKLGIRHDIQALQQNQRCGALRRRIQQHIIERAHKAKAKIEVAKLVPTGNRLEDALTQLAVTWGGLTAEQAMARR